MAYSPKDIEEIMDDTIRKWQNHSPTKSYGGVTLEDLIQTAEEGKKPRRKLKEIATQRRSEIAKRKDADKIFMKKRARLIAGIIADEDEGPDSSFYGSLGYVRESERKSGLTRKKNKQQDPNT